MTDSYLSINFSLEIDRQKNESVDLGRSILTSSDPIRTKIIPFDLPSQDESNGIIFVRIGSLEVKILRPKLTDSFWLVSKKMSLLL